MRLSNLHDWRCRRSARRHARVRRETCISSIQTKSFMIHKKTQKRLRCRQGTGSCELLVPGSDCSQRASLYNKTALARGFLSSACKCVGTSLQPREDPPSAIVHVRHAADDEGNARVIQALAPWLEHGDFTVRHEAPVGITTNSGRTWGHECR